MIFLKSGNIKAFSYAMLLACVAGFVTLSSSSAQMLYPTDTRKAAPTTHVKGKAQTVSVSPYARSNRTAATPVARPPAITPPQRFPTAAPKQPQHVLSLPDKYKQAVPVQPPATQPTIAKPIVTKPILPPVAQLDEDTAAMPATPLATTEAAKAPVPDKLTKPLQGMSIADVIDSTIKNAPDLPQQVATVAPPEKIVDETPDKPALLSVSEPDEKKPSAAQPHQPSKQAIAGLGDDKPRFYWPLRGKVVSTYGAKGSGRKNDGMNISAPKGTAIRAAATGLVVYSGKDLGGLGNLVLIRHSGGYHTAYAHVDNPLVQTGDKVKAGEAIANVGKTGNVTTPQLHFEIRDGKKPVNPAGYLPQA